MTGMLLMCMQGRHLVYARLISSCTFGVLLTAQRVVSSERQASDEASDPLASPAGPTTSTKSKGTGSSPTLKDMLQAGVLQPGQDNATVTYKGVTYSASLQGNGTILFKGERVASRAGRQR